MNYRSPHHLRVVTLSSREGTGKVLYPPEFARLASSPNPGGAPHTPVPSQKVPRARETRGAAIVLGVGFALLVFAYLTEGPLSVVAGAGAAAWTLAGAWIIR